MSRSVACWAACLCAAALFAAFPIQAADNENRPANATGSTSAWAPQVQTDPKPSSGQSDPMMSAHVERINAYFNDITYLQGRFVQIDPMNERTTGKFYVLRPGRLRFDYSPPSRMRVVSDGTYLAIEDHDLRTVDKYPLEQTPFKMLLADNVDLLKDARIVGFAAQDGRIMLAVEDKSGESSGRIQLFFTAPELKLLEWVITDPQGLNTRIQLADLQEGKTLSENFFDTTTVKFPSFED